MKKFIWFLFINMFLIIQISAQSNGVINRNFSMQNVILPDTKPEEWNEISFQLFFGQSLPLIFYGISVPV